MPFSPRLTSAVLVSLALCSPLLAQGDAAYKVVQKVTVGGDGGWDYLIVDPVTVQMAHTETVDGGNEIFSTTTPLPVAGPVGYTVRVLPHHPLLAGDNELGLVTMA